ncbi:MAG: endonuclease VIII [Myxococcota bacterium]
MPEGPEIHRAADKLATALVGSVVEDLYFKFEHLQPWVPHLQGQAIAAVEARGKAMLIRFPNQLSIYSHNQLYGKWMVRKRGSQPKTNRDLRLAIHTQKKSALLYSASDIVVLKDEDLGAHDYIRRLGPDLLDEAVTEDDVLARLKDKRFHRRGLAGLYLNQGFLSGPGNYLRSEILFVAGLHPRRRPCDLDEEALQRLAKASLDITRRAYHHRGVTTDPDLAKRLKAKGWTYAKYRHYVFVRAGKTCHVCGRRIEKDEISSRRIYICPGCQPREG